METASAHCPKESPCRCADCGGIPAGYSPAEDSLRDGIVLSDGQDTVIYNQRSYCRLLQHLITTYTTAAPAEAAACMEARRSYLYGSSLANRRAKIEKKTAERGLFWTEANSVKKRIPTLHRSGA